MKFTIIIYNSKKKIESKVSCGKLVAGVSKILRQGGDIANYQAYRVVTNTV